MPLFGNETISVLEQELFFGNEMTSFDIENHEDVTVDLTKESIFFTNGTNNKEFDVDNSITETVVRSKCAEVNNNDYSPKAEFNSVFETSPWQCETIQAEKIHQPDVKKSYKEVLHVNDFNSSSETPEQCETTQTETNMQSTKRVCVEIICLNLNAAIVTRHYQFLSV